MFTLSFWKDAFERSIRTFAQALLAHATVAEGFAFSVEGLKVAGAAAIASTLMSVGTRNVGKNKEDASIL